MTRKRVTTNLNCRPRGTSPDPRRVGSRALMSLHVPLVDWLTALDSIASRGGREYAEATAAELAAVIGRLLQGHATSAPLVVTTADVTGLVDRLERDVPTGVERSVALLGLWVGFLEDTRRWAGTTAQADQVIALIHQRCGTTADEVDVRPADGGAVMDHLGGNRAAFERHLTNSCASGGDTALARRLLSVFEVSLGQVLAAEAEDRGPNWFSADTVGHVLRSHPAHATSADGKGTVEVCTTAAMLWWEYLDFLEDTGVWEGTHLELLKCRAVVQKHLPAPQRENLDFIDEMEQPPTGADDAFLENALPVRVIRALQRVAPSGTPLPRGGEPPVPVLQAVARLLRRDSTVDEASWFAVTWGLLQQHRVVRVVGAVDEPQMFLSWRGDPEDSEFASEIARSLVTDYVEDIITARLPSSTARVVGTSIGKGLDGREFDHARLRREVLAALPPGSPPEDVEESVADAARELDRLVDDGILLEQPTPSTWRVPPELRLAFLKR